MTKPHDQAIRDRAIRQPGDRLLVEAGAGTGKTTLLVERAVFALLEEGLELDQMVLITFMDKAADEISVRLRTRLAAESRDGRRVRRLVDTLSSAHIQTIHSFCREVLAEFAIEAGIPPRFIVVDAYQADKLWTESFARWLAEPGISAALEPFIRMGVPLDGLAKWARQVSQWPEVPPTIPPLADPEVLVEEFMPRFEEAWRRAQMATNPGEPGYLQARAYWNEFSLIRQMPRQDWPRLLGQFRPTLAPKGNQRHWNPPNWLKDQKALVAQWRETLIQFRRQWAERMLGQWLDLMRENFLPFWRKARWDQGVLTFDDLLWETRRLLGHRKDIAERLGRRYRLIMVDEFQDTDPIQMEIITQIADAGASRLFLVGDPKQSIYRFRGADVETYASVREKWRQGSGEVLAITQNFRSQKTIIDVVNRVFVDLFPAQTDPERSYLAPFEPLVSQFPEDQRVRVIVDGGPVAGKAEERRLFEAELAAELIVQAVSQGWPVFTRDGERPIEYEDIALIVPTRTGLEIYRQVLERYGIPTSSQIGRGFFIQDEIRGFQSLLAALSDPDDERAVAGWLLSPWAGVSSRQLAVHRRRGGSLSLRVSSEGDPIVLRWIHQLQQWHQDFWARWPEGVLEDALGVTGLANALAARGDAQALANLQKLRSMCRDLGGAWGIEEFTRWLTEKVQSQADEPEAEVGDVRGAIQVTTVHQSKGLEWPLVIVANWAQRGKKPEPGLYYDRSLGVAALHADPWDSLKWEHVATRAARRDEAESDRLLYVALTRARDYLAVLETWAADGGQPGPLHRLTGLARLSDIGQKNCGPKPSSKHPPKNLSESRRWGSWRSLPAASQTVRPRDRDRDLFLRRCVSWLTRQALIHDDLTETVRQWWDKAEPILRRAQGGRRAEQDVPLYANGQIHYVDLLIDQGENWIAIFCDFAPTAHFDRRQAAQETAQILPRLLDRPVQSFYWHVPQGQVWPMGPDCADESRQTIP